MAPAIERWTTSGCTHVGVRGPWDVEAAQRLRAVLDQEPDGDVVLDFAQVSSFLDSYLPMLVVMVVVRSRSHPRSGMRLLGLRQHQERILRHFGLEVGHDGAARVLAARPRQ